MGIIDCINRHIPCLLSRKTAFISMTFLLSAFFLTEIVVGYITNSMALIADSFHMLSDVASLIVGYLALRYSNIEAPRDRYTFGYARAEVLGALVNAVFLVALCFSIFIEAMKRLFLVEGIEDPLLVFSVGAIGLIVNAFGVFLFHQQGIQHGHSHGGHGHSHGGHGHSHGGHGHGHEEKSSSNDVENGNIEGGSNKVCSEEKSLESTDCSGVGYESQSHSVTGEIVHILIVFVILPIKKGYRMKRRALVSTVAANFQWSGLGTSKRSVGRDNNNSTIFLQVIQSAINIAAIKRSPVRKLFPNLSVVICKETRATFFSLF